MFKNFKEIEDKKIKKQLEKMLAFQFFDFRYGMDAKTSMAYLEIPTKGFFVFKNPKIQEQDNPLLINNEMIYKDFLFYAEVLAQSSFEKKTIACHVYADGSSDSIFASDAEAIVIQKIIGKITQKS